VFSRAYKTAVTVPPLLWVTLFLLVPYALLFGYSFWTVSPAQTIVHHWNLGNYRELLHVHVYFETLLRSLWIAVRVMLFALLLGYPLAYYLSFHAGVRKHLLYQLVIIPLWVSYLVRAYAWKTILGSDGVLNTLLQYAHLTRHPVEFLLYSPFAVVLTLTHIYTPFAFLPIYASLEHIPRNLVEASHDLGASPLQPVSTATSVQVRSGKQLVTDGPFAETREQLGGYFLVEARDLDEAISIAARIPGARKGTVEVRPVVEIPGLPAE